MRRPGPAAFTAAITPLKGRRSSTDHSPPWRFALKMLSRQKFRLASAFFWSCVYILIPMQVPVLTGAVIDGLSGQHASVHLYGWVLPDQRPAAVLQFAGLGLLAVAIGYGLTAYLRRRSVSKVTRRFLCEIRAALLAKFESMPLDLHHKFGAGELLNRIVVDTASMRTFAEKVVIQAGTNVVRITYPAIMLFWLDWFLALLACAVLPLQWAVTELLKKRLNTALADARRLNADLTTVAKEYLDGIETIQSAGARFPSAATNDLEAAELRSGRLASIVSAATWTLTSLGVAVTWWLGGWKVLRGELTAGDLVIFTGMLAYVYAPLRRFGDVVDVSRRTAIGLAHIRDLLETPHSLTEAPDAKPLRVDRGVIELCQASVVFEQRSILNSVTLRIEPGEITAIAGRSGCGKSSLVRLLMRTCDPERGCVLIDGQDLRSVTLDSLRAQVAVVTQRPVLFSGTILDNLALGVATPRRAQLDDACRAADALGIIDRLEHGYATRVGKGGTQLSGGEIQRLAIARALLREPRILLLDEATSALDVMSQTAIMDTLDRLKGRMTIVLIGHRMEALTRADRLIVLDRGRIMDHGTRRDRLSSPVLYSLLANGSH